MLSESLRTPTVVGCRMRSRREALGWAQEKVGVLIGIDESSSRARISRYDLGTHEPPVKTARKLAQALGVPLAYLYCDDEGVAELLLQLYKLDAAAVRRVIDQAMAFAVLARGEG